MRREHYVAFIYDKVFVVTTTNNLTIVRNSCIENNATSTFIFLGFLVEEQNSKCETHLIELCEIHMVVVFMKSLAGMLKYTFNQKIQSVRLLKDIGVGVHSNVNADKRK